MPWPYIAFRGWRFMPGRHRSLLFASAALFMAAISPPAAAQPELQPPVPGPVPQLRLGAAVASDSISWDTFRAEHVFSLDHFLENVSGFVLGRPGAIGAPARVSRFGMGSGRCVVLLDGIPMNDPQNDIAELALIPTTDVGSITFGHRGSANGFEGIEGVIAIEPPQPPMTKPESVMELSKGTNDLKQRRVRFSSIRSKLGIDIAYDELLNDGYQLDAREIVTAPDLGRFASRVYSMRARGTLNETDEYSLSFKRHTSTYLGSYLNPGLELRRTGHLAVVATRLGRLQLKAFEREFEYALSSYRHENQTIGAVGTVAVGTGGNTTTSVTAGFEDLVSRQESNGAVAHPDLQKARIGVSAGRGWRGFQADFDVSAQHQFSYASGWGGGVSLARQLNARHRARATIERSYRLPNLEELFTPRYASAWSDSLFFAGNPELGSEHAYEIRAVLTSDLGRVRNEFSVSVLRVGDPVVPVTLIMPATALGTLENGKTETATVLMDRISVSGTVVGIHADLGGGVVFNEGDKDYFLRSVPQTRVDASLSLGRMLFRPSTDMVFTAQFQHSAARRYGIAGEIPSYQVLNLKLDARLLDAHLYLMWLNVTDARYRTEEPYIMTPRTFVYGVEWTIFN